MPHVSQNPLSREMQDSLTKTLRLILTKIHKAEEMQAFLLFFLTPTEQVMLAKRLAVMVFLQEGYDDAYISDVLHVTRVTVGRLRLLLEARGEGFAIAQKVLQNEKLMKEIKEMLRGLTSYAAKAAGGRL